MAFSWLDNQVSAELLKLAESVARDTGALLMDRPDTFTLTEKSSAVDFATQMDKAAEELIVYKLLAARPDDGIIAEEGSSRESKSGITWVIDPIDGTVNYLYGLPGWNVSIAAKDKDGVVVGVVFAPTLSSLWSAIRGQGALHNGKKIKCNDPVSLDRALIATGFAYDLTHRMEQGAAMANLLPKIRDLRRNGAAAVDLCYVAMGAVDAYFESSLKEWDLAAGGLIASEAGAKVSGRAGGAPDSELVICAGGALHAALLPLL
jgi:myo-inositol-1(or 4)-monophosphatase